MKNKYTNNSMIQAEQGECLIKICHVMPAFTIPQGESLKTNDDTLASIVIQSSWTCHSFSIRKVVKKNLLYLYIILPFLDFPNDEA